MLDIEKTKVARDWKKIVADSKGTQVFLPETLLEDVKKWQTMRSEFNKFISEIAQKEIQVNVVFQNLMLKIREYYAENGMSDIWVKDVGIENEALKEGQFILNITDEQRGGGMPPTK